MKVNYNFANGEVVAFDVDEKWAMELVELDRLEHNNDQNERRRHASLEAFNLDETLFPSDEDVEMECIKKLEADALKAAIEQLLPQQSDLIKKMFIEGRSIISIAREEGVGESAVRDRLNRIYKNLKKFLK